MASNNIVVAALGRPFTLGMLYDARKDELIPGLTLWDEKTLNAHVSESSHQGSTFQISASDAIEEKSSLLDVEASLRASFLCGLIEVGGSAKYLNDQRKCNNQSRVTCQYKATTNFKELSVTHLEIKTKQMDVIKNGLATHVVTGILYGANSFFVFDSEKLEASKVHEVQGSMEAVIKKIPTFDFAGKVDIKLDEKEKALIQKFSCKFYGDFILERNPTTFEQAVNTYAQLPKLLGENGKNAVPLKVWLMPLKNLDANASELTREISIGLVRKVQDVLEDLREIGMRCSDNLQDKVVKNVPQIQEEFLTFQKLCGYYESNICQTMAQSLPSLREGKEDESSVETLFEDRNKSPFSHEKLSKWLDHKKREVNVIRSLLHTCGMKEESIIPDQSELDRQVLGHGVEDVVCFVFTSVDRGDTYLDEMATFLDAPKLGSTNEVQWYTSDEVLKKMRKKAEAFHKAKTSRNNRFRFLVAFIANKKYTGATIYHYKNGILVTDDFSILPPVETITDRQALIKYACNLTLNPNTANSYLILSRGDKMAECGSWQYYPDHPERFDTHTQVLCREGLNKCHYWEVEWSTGSHESVYIIAGYMGVKRKGGGPESELGRNCKSWAFGQFLEHGKHKLKAWHCGLAWESDFPCDGCSRVGVYLDWPGGTLSFYKVSYNTLRHLYTFTTTFTEPVYPGLWAYNRSNYAYLCPI